MALVISTTMTGLQEFDFSAPSTDSYTVQGTIQAPNIVPSGTQGAGGGAGTGTGGGPQVNSQVLTVIKLNNTTKYTGTAGDRGFTTTINATAGDTIKVILSSSLAQDNQPQAIQCTIAISEGPL